MSQQNSDLYSRYMFVMGNGSHQAATKATRHRQYPVDMPHVMALRAAAERGRVVGLRRDSCTLQQTECWRQLFVARSLHYCHVCMRGTQQQAAQRGVVSVAWSCACTSLSGNISSDKTVPTSRYSDSKARSFDLPYHPRQQQFGKSQALANKSPRYNASLTHTRHTRTHTQLPAVTWQLSGLCSGQFHHF